MSDLWAVSFRGPDDLIAAPDALSAHRAANRFNQWWAEQIAAKGLREHDPHLWALPIIWPYTPQGHEHSLANPSADYSGLFIEPADGLASHGREGAE